MLVLSGQGQPSGEADTSCVFHSWLSKGVAGYSDLMGAQAVSLLLLMFIHGHILYLTSIYDSIQYNVKAAK